MKNSVEIVNGAFEKMAAAKGRDASRVYQRNQQRKAEQNLKNMARRNAAIQGPAPMASAGNMTQKARALKEDAAKALKNQKLKGTATKAGLALAGTGAAIGAGIAAKKMLDTRKQEKTALDIVNESYEKQASIANAVKGVGAKAVNSVKKTGLGSAIDDYARTSRNLDKMKDLAVHGAKTGNKSYTQMAGDGIKHLESRKRIAGKQVKHEFNKVPGHIVNFAKQNKGLVGAGAIAGGTTLAANHYAKKQEKTAQEIVSEAFEKIK